MGARQYMGKALSGSQEVVDIFVLKPGRIPEVSMVGSAFFSFPWGRLLVTLAREIRDDLKHRLKDLMKPKKESLFTELKSCVR